jgi:hypothetical protein
MSSASAGLGHRSILTSERVTVRGSRRRRTLTVSAQCSGVSFRQACVAVRRPSFIWRKASSNGRKEEVGRFFIAPSHNRPRHISHVRILIAVARRLRSTMSQPENGSLSSTSRHTQTGRQSPTEIDGVHRHHDPHLWRDLDHASLPLSAPRDRHEIRDGDATHAHAARARTFFMNGLVTWTFEDKRPIESLAFIVSALLSKGVSPEHVSAGPRSASVARSRYWSAGSRPVGDVTLE